MIRWLIVLILVSGLSGCALTEWATRNPEAAAATLDVVSSAAASVAPATGPFGIILLGVAGVCGLAARHYRRS